MDESLNIFISIWGTQMMKSAQGTIKILMNVYFSSDLNLFLTIIGGSAKHGGGLGSILRGGRAISNRYKVTSLSEISM